MSTIAAVGEDPNVPGPSPVSRTSLQIVAGDAAYPVAGRSLCHSFSVICARALIVK